ncbi:MAG TPA: hypothetical protein VNI01_03415 [Elusimicrobiota bacterium]|nr:hypothetical protein [Elusimicrobiota bacterium]
MMARLAEPGPLLAVFVAVSAAMVGMELRMTESAAPPPRYADRSAEPAPKAAPAPAPPRKSAVPPASERLLDAPAAYSREKEERLRERAAAELAESLDARQDAQDELQEAMEAREEARRAQKARM